MAHASILVVCRMTNVYCDLIDDVEKVLLSPHRCLPKALLIFKRVSFIPQRYHTPYIFCCVIYTLLCFFCVFMKCFVRNDEIKLCNRIG